MEEGTKTKKTVFVSGLGDDIDESVIVETFSTFGDIIEVQLPTAAANPSQQTELKHRGFAFVTYGTSEDAQDAIDNMDMNELRGKVLKVNLARNLKVPTQGAGNRAIWETEDWLRKHAKPLSESGGARIQAPKPGQDSPQTPAAEDEAMED